MNPTIYDVSRLSGVSIATVSRTFSNPDLVRENTRRKVFEAAEILHYSPNAIARAMARQRTDKVAFLICKEGATILDEFYAGICIGIMGETNRIDRELVISTAADWDLTASNAKNKQVDGVILGGNARPELVSELQSRGLAVVLVNNRMAGFDIPCVVSDEYGGVRQALEHLIARGHRNIAMLAGRFSPYILNERYRAFLEIAQSHGLSTDARQIRLCDPAVDSAETSREDSLLSAKRSVENAESSLAQANEAYSQAQASASLTARTNAAEAEALRLEKEKNDEKIDLLASLVEAGGLVSAPRSTLLTVCDLEQGQPCPEGECLQLAKEDSEMLVRFTLPAEQAEKITAGLAIAVTQGSASAEAAVRTVETDEEKQTGLVTAVLDETAAGFKAGAARAELVFSRNVYDLCLPVSALRQDGQGSYVLAVEETKNAFGLSLTALRVLVTVKEVDSDGQYAAVEGSIGGGVIVSSNRAVSPGASVRMEE